MKIAFVGKGGAGKSTISTAFFLYLLTQHIETLFIDGDVNIHIPHLLGIPVDSRQHLSHPSNTRKIQEYLIGQSAHITSPEAMYKTTPPSRGCNLLEIRSTHPIISEYTVPIQDIGYVAVVGSYEKEGIGTSCYHEHLSVMENILSFAHLQTQQCLLTDMVAGVDAFSNTLHMQYDLLVLVIEPTMEGIKVYEQYQHLAKEAQVENHIKVLGNKIEGQEDIAFLHTHIPTEQLLGYIPLSRELKVSRQKNTPLTRESLQFFPTEVFQQLIETLRSHKQDPREYLDRLHKLHLNYAQQEYVKNASGDISNQIDPTFVFPS